MMQSVTLYGTGYCHLCEQAEAIVADVCSANGITVHHVDIAHHDALMARYGDRIPVLVADDDGAELNWPFEVLDVMTLTNIPGTGRMP